jgi:hypothetical protein
MKGRGILGRMIAGQSPMARDETIDRGPCLLLAAIVLQARDDSLGIGAYKPTGKERYTANLFLKEIGMIDKTRSMLSVAYIEKRG